MSHLHRLAALACLPACSFTPGQLADGLDDAAVVSDDADRLFLDARVDAPLGHVCFGTGLFGPCYPADQTPTGELRPQTTPINTADDANCDRIIMQGNGPELCVMTAGTIIIDRAIRYEGARPIVLLASDTITITSTGTLDVSRGAGYNTGPCAGATNGRNTNSNSVNAGAGGGGGGGFGTAGGAGGAGNSVAGGDGGAVQMVTYIRGGCPGRRGGNSNNNHGGNGGNSGGGVYLVAGTQITIDGTINANGAGGRGGGNKAGGGGGGSGGLIGLDAPTIVMGSAGMLMANGGGGGEGGGGGLSGGDGGMSNRWDRVGAGGAGIATGGNGGDGAIGTATGGAGREIGNGGGGGGGGVGAIQIYAQTRTLNTRVSPPVP